MSADFPSGFLLPLTLFGVLYNSLIVVTFTGVRFHRFFSATVCCTVALCVVAGVSAGCFMDVIARRIADGEAARLFCEMGVGLAAVSSVMGTASYYFPRLPVYSAGALGGALGLVTFGNAPPLQHAIWGTVASSSAAAGGVRTEALLIVGAGVGMVSTYVCETYALVFLTAILGTSILYMYPVALTAYLADPAGSPQVAWHRMLAAIFATLLGVAIVVQFALGNHQRCIRDGRSDSLTRGGRGGSLGRGGRSDSF